MDETDGAGDDRTFRANFAGEGAAKLREIVLEKLKEFMGDYTDDTLVEYVIVLLRNGRHKEEAKRELHVFLGDSSDSFISWLWDHLSLNMHLYVQQKEPLPDDMPIRKATATEQYERTNSQGVQASGASHAGSEHQGGNLVNVSRSRRKREWNGLVGEMSESFPLRSTVTEALHSEQKTCKKPDVRHSATLRPQLSRKRNREDERRQTKRDKDLLPKLAPSRRLLEFAVRDAVKTVQPSSSTAELSVKRLRSVVFSSIDTTLGEKPHRPRSTLRMLGSVSVALKAAAEAAEDVSKSRNTGNIFDRFGHGRAVVEPIDHHSSSVKESIFDRFGHGRAVVEPIDHHSSSVKESILQDGENEELGPIARSGQVDYNKKNEYKGEFAGNSSLFERDADMPADSASDNDNYDDFGIANDNALDISQGAYSSNKKDNSVMQHYNVSKYTDAALKKTRLVQLDPPPSASTKPSSKIVNISVNVNAWKPTNYYLYRNDKAGEIQMGEKNEEATVQPNVNTPLLKENTVSISGNDKDMASDMQKEFQKSQASTPGISYTSSRPSDDVDSRTNFISNVHFAATKDTLSRHFNKFGEVLKVIIVTDPINGQPIGSAYVEFLRKESAELALSLNGTSFMSRILKVVRRNFVEAPVMGWPRIARTSSFASRFGRMPLPRSILPGAIRARLPIKPGAKSMQWKRDSAASPTFGGTKSVKNTLRMPANAPPSKTGQNLKYVRPGSQA